MKFKKLFILIPGILSLFSLSACNEESYSYIEDDDEAREALANYNYKFDSETKEVTLKEYKGNPGEVEIPGVVGTYTVNKIGAKCFKGKGITKLTIPDTIVYIGNSAFVYNTIEEIDIPDSVVEMGRDVLFGTTTLTKATIGSGMTSIPTSLFDGCSELSDVKIEGDITTIYERAFCGCSSLTSLVLPSSLKQIRTTAFKGCSILNTFYYKGSEEDYSRVFIYLENEDIENINVVYNYVEEKED